MLFICSCIVEHFQNTNLVQNADSILFLFIFVCKITASVAVKHNFVLASMRLKKNKSYQYTSYSTSLLTCKSCWNHLPLQNFDKYRTHLLCKYLLSYTFQTRLVLTNCVQNRFVIIVFEFVTVDSTSWRTYICIYIYAHWILYAWILNIRAYIYIYSWC